MKELSYWTKYILSWLGTLIVYAYADMLGMILGFILALEFVYQRLLREEPKGEV